MNVIHEIAQYRVKAGTAPEQLRKVLRPLHDWIAIQPGCIEVRSYLAEDGLGVTDQIAWATRAQAEKAMAATEHHETLQALLPLCEPGSFSCAFKQLLLETRP